jgi:hypothetical protein
MVSSEGKKSIKGNKFEEKLEDPADVLYPSITA